MKKSLQISVFLVLVTLFLAGCSGGGNGTPNPNSGFKIDAYAYNPNNPSVLFHTAGNVRGQFIQPDGATTGTIESFNQGYSGIGYLVINSARVPGLWRLTLGPDFLGGSLCLTFETSDRHVTLNSLQTLTCRGISVGLTVTPNTIDALNPPATVTFSGKGVQNTFGEPNLAICDEFGNVIASTQVQANQLLWVGGEIDSVVVSTPDLSQAYDGTYMAIIRNVGPDGTLEAVGASPVTIYGNPPPPPPPPPDDGGGDGGGTGCQGPDVCLEQ